MSTSAIIAREKERAKHRLLGKRYLVLLIALLLLFALYPFIDQEVAEAQHVSVFFTVILVAGIYAVSHNRRFLVIAIVLAAGILGAQGVAYLQQMNPFIISVSRGFGALFFLLTAVAILTNVLKSETVTADKIYGAICAYLLLALMWAFLFCVLEVLHPGSFLQGGQLIATGHTPFPQFALISTLIYYSMSTIATVGYGDILPRSGPARALSNLEAITGQMFLAILIARLVAMQIAHGDKQRVLPKDDLAS